MSHHLLRAGRIVREWTVFDEFALMKRLFAPD
jgi:predicted ester cyclase